MSKKTIQQLLGEGYYVNINMSIIDLVGSYEAAAILTRAIYWEGIAGGDFYKTNDDWIDELRLSERRLSSARQAASPYLQWELRGTPAKNYYWVDYEALERDLGDQPLPNVATSTRQNVAASIDKTSEQDTDKTSELLYDTNNTSNNTSKALMSNVSDADGFQSFDRVSTKQKPIDDEAYAISDSLDRLIQDRLPNRHKQKTALQRVKAALDIERLYRLDGHEYKLIDGIMRWSQQDDFWSGNILSAATLRKQFDRLYLKAKSEAEKKSKTVTFIS